MSSAKLKKPSELVEYQLIEMILSGEFPVGSGLPGERDLAEQLGATRPTLREVLQRLATAGWVDIQHGKQTKVKDYLVEGNLAALATLAKHSEYLPKNFVLNLLEVREALAPAYTKLAVEKMSGALFSTLENALKIPDEPEAFVTTDWNLHVLFTIQSQNPIFSMILNGFEEIYKKFGSAYFYFEETRSASRDFYSNLYQAVMNQNPEMAKNVTKQAMTRSIELWKRYLGK